MDTDRYIKIRKELDDIKGMIENVNNQMQELRSAIRGAPNENKVLQMRESYQHPWWKHHGERSDVS
jgi:archaellum component FlaC